MLTRTQLRMQLQRHLDGLMTLEELSAWADLAFRETETEPRHREQITTCLSALRDATDPHRFRWEEPDFEGILEDLES